MSTFILVLLGIGIGILGFGFVSTVLLIRQKAQDTGHDYKIPNEVKGSPYLRNPIFLAYGVALAIALIIIAIYAFSLDW